MSKNIKGKTRYIVGIIISSFMAVAVIFITFFIPTLFPRPSVNNTFEVKATINNIELVNDKVSNITVDEYPVMFFISRAEIVDLDAFNSLKKGQCIYFTIINGWKEQFDNSSLEIVSVVAMRTEEVSIITLESHNKILQSTELKMKIGGVIFAVMFTIVTVLFAVKYRSSANSNK